ncbi:TRAP transporter large permease [Alkalibacter mobilis]|uniref:TRAP transporter large permease n=1 Tax=Alkalibacter mobilis TaxID=2787712 RepID=UPI00189D5E21|nr:TRAP transporter large permease [Alkalibacter mobilis]MBF7097001.1 TRAP transporter large permease [Alkalibacter mobilis]
MSPELIGVLGIVLLLILLAFRIPVGIAMIAVSVLGYSMIVSPEGAFAKLGADAFVNAKSYTLSVIPLFVLMGMVLSHANLGGELYQLFDVILGRVRGGMAMATLGASALFSAVSGSAVATASTIASVSVDEMRKYKYDDGLAAGCAAVGGTLGILIPPSSTLVIYGALTEETIGGLLIAGIIPGIMTTVMLMLTVSLTLKFKPQLAPVVNREKRKMTWDLLKTVWAIPTIFLISMGGIYLGWFTPTEAGAVGTFLSFVAALILKRLNWKAFKGAMSQATRITAMTFLIMVGGKMFGTFLSISRIPIYLTRVLTTMDVTPFLVIMAIFAIYLVMGAFMDAMAILVIMTPIVYPIVITLGYDGVWFGIMTVIMLLIALLTPPVGVVSLVVASITKVAPARVFKAVIPFWFTLIAAGIIVTLFPDIVLFLPSLMG